MSTASTKSASNSTLVEAEFDGFEVSDRTTSVDYVTMKTTTIKVLGSTTSAIGLAIKLNTRGMKVKPDDNFKVGGRTVKVADLVALIHAQEGYSEAAAKSKTLGKDSMKTLVSLNRVARAFAAETSHAIYKNIVKVEDDIAKMAVDAELPVQYAFLAAPWGMNDDNLRKHAQALFKFATSFDAMIKKAHGKGWCVGIQARSHADAIANYILFRGIDIS